MQSKSTGDLRSTEITKNIKVQRFLQSENLQIERSLNVIYGIEYEIRDISLSYSFSHFYRKSDNYEPIKNHLLYITNVTIMEIIKVIVDDLSM